MGKQARDKFKVREILIGRRKSSLITKGEQNLGGKILLEWEMLGSALFRAGITSFLFTILSPRAQQKPWLHNYWLNDQVNE